MATTVGAENDIPGVGGTGSLLGTTPSQLISAKSASDFDGAGDRPDPFAVQMQVRPEGRCKIHLQIPVRQCQSARVPLNGLSSPAETADYHGPAVEDE